MQTTPQVSSRQHQTSSPNGHRLKSISVIGGFLDGMQFDLADGLNCLIGARGTGKTTTLELLRYAIDALPTQAAERKRIESLVEENLAGGRIEVHVETKDGLPYTITRSWDEEPIVLAADGSPTAISLVGSGLFQADIFSQNEVECIADRAASQLAMFDNFEREAISQVDTQLNQVESALAANATRIIPLQDKLAALDDELGTLPSVEEKLKKFSTSRGEDSTEVDRAHAQKALRDRQRRAVDAAGEILRTMTRKLTSLTGQIDGQMATQIGPDMAAGPNGLLLREVTQGLSRCGREVDRLLEEARTRIAGAQEELARRSATLVTAHREQELAFRVVIEQHKQAQGEAAERAQLERRRNELLARRRLHQETAAQLKAVQGERQTLLSRLTELRDRRFGIRKDVVRRINEALSPTIRVSLMQHDDPRVYRRLVERGLRGPRMQHRVLAGEDRPRDRPGRSGQGHPREGHRRPGRHGGALSRAGRQGHGDVGETRVVVRVGDDRTTGPATDRTEGRRRVQGLAGPLDRPEMHLHSAYSTAGQREPAAGRPARGQSR